MTLSTRAFAVSPESPKPSCPRRVLPVAETLAYEHFMDSHPTTERADGEQDI